MDVPDINRNAETLFELLAENDAHAATLFNKLKQTRKVQWFPCDSLEEYTQLDDILSGITNTDIFIYCTMPKEHLNWDLIEALGTAPIEETLFRLWPDELRLYICRKGGKNSILGGELVSQNRELGL